ncbi:MAG TPA: secretin N-terminal domain-containing protein [Candidatus Tumulicola sp.]|nr:secretin N-terminal domain-containing protein [Candidatus Tumulicola sp.]
MWDAHLAGVRYSFEAALKIARIIVVVLAVALVLPSVFAPLSTTAATISESAGRISLTAENEPLRDVLLKLGRQVGINIVVGNDVQGRVSMTLHDVTLDQALEALTSQFGYRIHRSGNVIVIGSSAPIRTTGAVPSVTPGIAPAVIPVTVISADRAASVLRGLYPHAQINVDSSANAVIVIATPEVVQAMRGVLQGIDVQNPTRPVSEAVPVRTVNARALATRLQALYPRARISAGPNKTIIVVAIPQDLTQIKSVIASIDTPTVTPAPTFAAAEAVKVTQARSRDVARVVARQYPDVRASALGTSVILSGPPDAIAKAKALIALIDLPQAGSRFTQVYRIRFVDARSVAGLLTRSFSDIHVDVDADLNAISVLATTSEQQRIADAVNQLDVAPGTSGATSTTTGVAGAGVAGPGGTNIEVVTLKSAQPGLTQGAVSTTATDIQTTVTQALQGSAPDLRITVPPNSTSLVLSGSPYSIKLARQLIDKLDISPPQVVLDTEVLEVQESTAKNLGLNFPTAVIGTTYSEIQPIAPPTGGTPPPLLGIQPFTRTGISITAQLNFLIQHGQARVLADPRITTMSGRTASIKAGDNISILVTSGGGVGVPTQTSVQSFQTGVLLDITPVVNSGDEVSVTLHPNVSSLAGINNGVPQISSREVVTTVQLHDNQTLVIGGLIQESTTRTENRLPILGDLPLIGRIFRNQQLTQSRNELIIVVTPHILRAGENLVVPGPALPVLPTPRALPTLPPNANLPTPSGQFPMGLPLAQPTPSPQGVVGVSRQAIALPQPTPSAFAAANVFTFGSPPPNSYAGPTDPVRILYASFSPTVLRNGALVHVSVITTTNANAVTLGAGGYSSTLTLVSPGQWQASFPFNAGSIPLGQPQAQLTLTASKPDGSSANLQIPISVLP